MPHSNKPDLVLSVPCGVGRAHTRVLNPANPDTFRIVVRCSQEEVAAPTKLSSPSVLAAIEHGLLSIVALWRT